MTTKVDYTPEEWELIMNAPVMAATAVIAASPSGPIGLVKEMFAVGKILAEAGRQDSANQLVGALVSEMKAGHRPQAPAEKPRGIQEIKELALKTCRQVSELLARKTPVEEAQGFKRWLLTTAQGVAEASKEGGVLGLGGVRVSDAERAALAEIASALGIAA